MRNSIRVTLLALLAHASFSFAMPMLSDDGSSLTGVDVGGTLYDVMFGGGIIDDVYAGVAFNAARESEANAVSAAIVDALNFIGGVTGSAIRGCDAGPYGCILFNPDRKSDLTTAGFAFRDEDFARYIAGAGWGQAGRPIHIPGRIDPDERPYETNVSYRFADAAPVPAPATLLLFGLGLTGVGISRRERQNRSQSF